MKSSKPSQLKNCLVLVDIENTIECLGKKKCKMIIKIILFAVNNNSGWKLVLRLAKIFFRDHKPSLTLLLQQVVKGY